MKPTTKTTYILICHDINGMDDDSIPASVYRVGTLDEVADKLQSELENMAEMGYKFTDQYGDEVEPSEVAKLVKENEIDCVQADNDSHTVYTVKRI